jgi:uncharacterized phiE125 gp8 family phage protein
MALAHVRQREVTPRIVAMQQTTPPDNTPLLDTAKIHLKAGDTEAELLELELYVNNAVAYVERIGRRSLFNQAWTITLDTLPSGNYVQLVQGPVQSITTFTTYDDANNADTTFADYFEDTAGDRLCLNYEATWPTDLRHRASVTIEYATGYGDAVADLPPTMVQAVLLLVGHWHANRDLTCAVSKEMAYGVTATLGVNRRLHL